MAIWSRLTGAIAGLGVGGAAAAAMDPILEVPKQKAWQGEPNRVLDVGLVARLVAEGLTGLDSALDEAQRTGFNGNRLRAAIQLALTAPPVAEALELWRRGRITEEQFEHALAKARVEEQYWKGIKELYDARLDPAVIAVAIVRGIMRDPGFLPVGPPSAEGNVPAFPTSPLDTLDEAKAAGIGWERLFVETAIAGRPMGPEAAAAATFRGILERVDFERAIAEGDVRNEWAAAIFETARQIPSVSDYINAHLRGWITEADMNAGVARHGMSPADAHLLFLRTGRPAAPGQMATAAARGIDGPEGRPMDRAQFLKGIAESDIRPEWGPMLWDARFLYPPLFQLSRLVAGGAITPDTAAEWATKDRYPPEVVTALHAFWRLGTATTSKGLTAADLTAEYTAGYMSRAAFLSGLVELGYTPTNAEQKARVADAKIVQSARTSRITRIRSRYASWVTHRGEAAADLAEIGMTADAQSRLLDEWDGEREANVQRLAEADVKRLWKKMVWDVPTVLAWLEDHGYTATDAEAKVASWG